jgi:dihydrolipoamide dehydrogenase
MEKIHTQIVVVGGGPGGYAAAFYAADQGKKVILVEEDARLGGVCLNRGCIPSKAYLQATKMMDEARECEHRGISFGTPQVDLAKLRAWKESILVRLSQGLIGLAQRRSVTVMWGRGYFEDSQTLRVETSEGQKFVQFEQAIIAVGSKAAVPKVFDLGNPRIMTSTEALQLPEVPPDLLIIGGGYNGMELGTVYSLLGSKVVLVEALDTVLGGADKDLIRPVVKAAEKKFKEIRTKAKVTDMATAGKKIKVVMQSAGETKEELYDGVLVAVGRVPNGENLGLENTRVQRDERGYIKVNEHQQTDDPNLYAIGDIAGGVLLAHKAAKEARIAVDVILGEPSSFENIIIPAVVFTDPELAWCGLTEAEAQAKGIKVEVAKFPWSASGRALTFDRPDGMTKLIVEPETERIMGVGIVGHGAGELIAEGTLAVEMGATVRDLAECVHPHPTLSETLMECAEAFYGYATHTYTRKRAATT